jgi:predicted  nucleic acid-binding Zn-ribbon protein
MDTEMALDKKRIKPIVAQRDDMIGRPSSEATPSNGSSRKERNGNGSGTSGMSGGWKFLVLLAFFGLIGAGGFGLLQYQDLSGKHQALQARFEALESRLSSTDESVSQSGAALQVKISRQEDTIKEHWSEIKKLWGVTNDINKGKIEANKKDIAFLVGKRAAMAASLEKDSKSLTALSANYLGLSADLDTVNDSLRSSLDGLNRVNNSLTRIDRELKNNAEAIESMEAFRRQMNQKIYALEQNSSAPVSMSTPASTTLTN